MLLCRPGAGAPQAVILPLSVVIARAQRVSMSRIAPQPIMCSRKTLTILTPPSLTSTLGNQNKSRAMAIIKAAAGSERSAAAIPSLTNITPKAVIMITAVAIAMALPERDLNTCTLEVFHGQGRF